MENAATKQTDTRKDVYERHLKEHWNIQRRYMCELAADTWRSFCCFSTTYHHSPDKTTAERKRDYKYIAKYPRRYMLGKTLSFSPKDPEELRRHLVNLITGCDIQEVSQRDLEDVLDLFAFSIISCKQEQIVPDTPKSWLDLVFVSKIEKWISECAKATGADSLVKAYFAGVPYADLLGERK